MKKKEQAAKESIEMMLEVTLRNWAVYWGHFSSTLSTSHTQHFSIETHIPFFLWLGDFWQGADNARYSPSHWAFSFGQDPPERGSFLIKQTCHRG